MQTAPLNVCLLPISLIFLQNIFIIKGNKCQRKKRFPRSIVCEEHAYFSFIPPIFSFHQKPLSIRSAKVQLFEQHIISQVPYKENKPVLVISHLQSSFSTNTQRLYNVIITNSATKLLPSVRIELGTSGVLV